MKRLMQVFIFLFFFSALYGQDNGGSGAESPGPLPRMDEAVKSLAGDINTRLVAEKARRVAVGQWTFNGAVLPLGSYWTSQLIEELTNIPGRSFAVLAGEAASADWTVSGEILEAAGTVRVYTRIIRLGDRSLAAGFHVDFEGSPSISEMLSGGSGGPFPSIGRDAYEPDSRDNPVAVETAASTEDGPVISRTIHTTEDEDFFLISPGVDGALVAETTGSIDTLMDLYEAGSNSRLAEDDDGGTDSNARIRCTVQAGRTYVARVRGYDGTTGSYGFRAYLVETVRLKPDEYEGDDEASSAKDIAVGELQVHTFSTAGDVDWVKFQISQAGRYIIRARGANSAGLDTYIKLYDQDIELVDENDDGGENMDALLSIRLRNGTYYLKVGCLDETPDQPYTISIEGE
jgi:hypothetical protein